ncbi:MAG: right-handed parallel beta-helix repeat-containing protein, partial [Candidatus Pacearchaeota archaeon]
MLKEDWLKTIVIILFIVAAIALIFLFLKSDITGRVISIEKNEFMPNEPIKGSLDLKLKEGELIPSSTRVIVTLGNKTKELSFKEFVESSNLELAEQQGPFFLEGKELEGEGFGYGFSGHYIVYPDVFFQLKLSSENATNETFTNITNITEENVTKENITEENITEENLTNITNITEENVTKENITEEPGENVSEENVTEAPVEETVEEALPEDLEEQQPQEQPLEEPSEPPSEEQPQEQKETTTEETPTEDVPAKENNEENAEENQNSLPENPLTGFITFWFRALGIWNSFAVLEENPNYKIIEASCSYNNTFIYDLKEGEQVELVPGSVKTEDKKLDDNNVTLEIKENQLEVSTNYFESFEGFGESYLNKEKEHELNFNLSALNLSASEPGTYELNIKFLYQGQEIVSESKEIEIIPAIVNIKVVNKEGKVQDSVEVNSTELHNLKFKIGKIKVNGEEKHDIEIEYEAEQAEQEQDKGQVEKEQASINESNETEENNRTEENVNKTNATIENFVTGAAILEEKTGEKAGEKAGGEGTLEGALERAPQRALEQNILPESEINFISMPEDVVIQIDKAPDYQTEIFAIEPSNEIKIETATITLEKTTTQPIARILECDEWDIVKFKCQGSWRDSGLEFIDNGTHVSFNTTHFTAYIGQSNMTCPYYVNESIILVENISCSGTAFIINASNVAIDCQGYTINYSESQEGYGIDNSGGFDNVTIKNCVISQINSGQTYSHAIYAEGMENGTIENNVITTSGYLSLGIEISCLNSNNNTIRNNSVTVSDNGRTLYPCGDNNKILDNEFYGGDSILFEGNNITIEGNEFYDFAEMEIDGDNNYIASNYISDSKTGWADGTLYTRFNINNTIFNNTIVTSGDDANNGIWTDSERQSNISYNNIITDCNECLGIFIEFPYDFVLEYNNITTSGDGSYGFNLKHASSHSNFNRNITNNTIRTSGRGSTGIYLYETDNTDRPGRNVFRDNVIETAKGYGFDIVGDCDDPYSGYPSDIDTSNLVEGKPVYYYCNVSNTEISNLNAGQIIVGSTATWPDPSNLTLRNVTSEDGIMLIDYVEGVNITESTINTQNQESVAGVFIKMGAYSNIYNNKFTNNYYGIYDIYGNNYIHANNFTNNEYGFLGEQVSNDIIFYNHFTNNNYHILLNATEAGGGGGVSYHNVSFNNISGGSYGIYLSDEDNNDINNNILDDVDYAIYVASPGQELLASGSNDFTNNKITNSGVYDFYIEYADDPASGYDSVTNLTTNNVLSSFVPWNIALKATSSPGNLPQGYKDIGKFLNITNTSEEFSDTFSCIGKALGCWEFNETVCETQNGCYWDADGWCDGTHDSCDTYNKSHCATQQNCVWGVSNSPFITLSISYNDGELGAVNESTLAIWKYNGSWNQLPSEVNTTGNYVSADIVSFSIFAPLGQVQAASCGCNNGTYNYTCGETITSSCTMNCDLNASGTCFTIGADNIVV